MSDKRYINLQVTPKKWEDQYFGDFEAPIALYPAPSRPEPSPTPTPSSTPQPTPSVTPSSTPTVTPTISVTPSITPSISSTPAETPQPTPSVTPSFTPTVTPTPSSTPPPQYYILAENSDEIIAENSMNLIVESAPSVGANFGIAGGVGTELIGYSYTGDDIQQANYSTSNMQFLDIIYDNTRWLAVGGSQSGEGIYQSIDGINYIVVAGNNISSFQSNPEAIQWNGSYYLVGGASANGVNQLIKSTDFTNWTPASSLPTAQFGTTVRDFLWTGSEWWAIQGGTTSGVIFNSPDGENWVDIPVGTIGDGYTIAYDGSSTLVIGGDNGILYSTDMGNNWNGSSGTAGRITDIIWDGSQWVAVGENLYYTTNPSTWTQGTYPSISQMRKVTYTGNQYLAVGFGNNEILKSSDGRTWTSLVSSGTKYYWSVFSKERPDLIPPRQ